MVYLRIQNVVMIICLKLVLGDAQTTEPIAKDKDGNIATNQTKSHSETKLEDKLQPEESKTGRNVPHPQYDGFDNTVAYINFFRKAGYLDEQNAGSESFKASPFLKRFREFLTHELKEGPTPSESIKRETIINFRGPSNLTQSINQYNYSLSVPSNTSSNSGGKKDTSTKALVDSLLAAGTSPEFVRLKADIEKEAEKIHNKASATEDHAFIKKADGSNKNDDFFADIEYPSSDDDYPVIDDSPTNNDEETPSYKAFPKTYNQNGYFSPTSDVATSSLGFEKYNIPKSQISYHQYPAARRGNDFNNPDYPSLKQKVYNIHPYRSKVGRNSADHNPQVTEEFDESPDYEDKSDFLGLEEYADYAGKPVNSDDSDADDYDEEGSQSVSDRKPDYNLHPESSYAQGKKKKPDDEYDLGDEEEDKEENDEGEYYDEKDEPGADYSNILEALKKPPEANLDMEFKPSISLPSKLDPSKVEGNVSKKVKKRIIKKYVKMSSGINPAETITSPKKIKHCTLKNKTSTNDETNGGKYNPNDVIHCYLCTNLENGEKTEQCSNSTNRKKSNKGVNSGESSVGKGDDSKTRVRRQIPYRPRAPESKYRSAPGRRAPRKDDIESELDFNFDNADEDLENDDLDFFSDEVDDKSTDADEYMPPAEAYREMSDSSCRKVRKNGLNCLVCEKPNSAGTFEQCSYESDPKENAYEYSTKETYGSGNKPYNQRYRRSRKYDPKNRAHKRHKKDLTFGKRNILHDSVSSSDGKFTSSDDITPSSEGKLSSTDGKFLSSQNAGLYSENVQKRGASSYGLRKDSNEDFLGNIFPNINVPGLDSNKFSSSTGKFSSNLDDIIQPQSDLLPDFKTKSPLRSQNTLFKKRPSLFDNRPSLKLTQKSNSYDSLLDDFTGKDRSKCKKEIKDGATCYYCKDDEGSEHEECMYVKKSNPENKQVKYHQTKEVKSPLKGQKAADKFDEILNSSPYNTPRYGEGYGGTPFQYSESQERSVEEAPDTPISRTYEPKPNYQTNAAYYAEAPAVSTVSRTDYKGSGDGRPIFYHYNTQHHPGSEDSGGSTFSSGHLPSFDDSGGSAFSNGNLPSFDDSSIPNFPAQPIAPFELNNGIDNGPPQQSPPEFHGNNEEESTDVDSPDSENEFQPESESRPDDENDYESDADDTELVYDKEFKMTLPKFMVEKTPEEKEFDDIYGAAFEN